MNAKNIFSPIPGKVTANGMVTTSGKNTVSTSYYLPKNPIKMCFLSFFQGTVCCGYATSNVATNEKSFGFDCVQVKQISTSAYVSQTELAFSFFKKTIFCLQIPGAIKAAPTATSGGTTNQAFKTFKKSFIFLF